jgi:hypothetical protein
MNQISIDIEGGDYTFNIFNNFLSLSSTKSLFSNDISIRVGTVSTLEAIPDEEAMKRIRFYIDHQRNVAFDLTKTDAEFLNERLINYKKQHKIVNQERLQLLLLFMINMAKSIGEETITQEACDEAEKLFTEIFGN